MSCNKQGFPAAFCDFIEVATGEKVSQRDWHALKKLAADEGLTVGKQRLSKWDAMFKFDELKLAIVVEGDSQLVLGSPEYREMSQKWDDSTDAAHELISYLKPPAYTANTDAIITYLTRHGVKRALARARGTETVNDVNDAPLRVTHALATPTAGVDYHDYGIGTAYETRTMRPLPDGNYETTGTAYYVEGYDSGSTPTAPYRIVECVNVTVHSDPDDAGQSQISSDWQEYIFMDEGLFYDRLEDAESVAEHYAKNLEK